MPELPEVETVRAGLAAHVVGRTVESARVHHPRAVRRHLGGGAELAARLRGRRLDAAVRRGKYLWLVLDDGSEALLAHLGMSGQLLVRRPADGAGPAATSASPASLVRPVPLGAAHLRVELTFSDGWGLSFVDQRTFGHLLVADLVPTADDGPGGAGSPLAALPSPVAHIARDLLDPHLDRAATSRRLRARRTEVKRALLDQTLVSGIGNIYADEALWRAGLHPRRPTDRLRPATVAALLGAAEAVMRDALAAGGTSFDALYVDVEGAGGYFARSLDAYGRTGLPCHRCGTPMVREIFLNRSSHLCPRCQRPPRARTAERTPAPRDARPHRMAR